MIEIKPPHILLTAKPRRTTLSGAPCCDGDIRRVAKDLGVTVDEALYSDGFEGVASKVAKADMVVAVLARDVPEGYRKGLIHETPEGPVAVSERTPFIEGEIDAGIAYVMGCAYSLNVPTLIFRDRTFSNAVLKGYPAESAWGVCDIDTLRMRLQDFTRCYERYVGNAQKPNLREFSEALRTVYAPTRMGT